MALYCTRCGEENKDTAKFCSKCGEALEHAGTTIIPAPRVLDNRYEIISTVKSGAMGCVYKAQDMRLKETVAVKQMLSSCTDPSEKSYTKDRFEAEARLLFTLHHNGLPKVSDFFTEKNPDTGETAHYLVMTFIDGKDLETIIEDRGKGPFSVKEVLDYTEQILDILEYLHNQNPPIIYRDLNARNIMIKEGKVFLVDFGIARAFKQNQRGTAVGTPGYAPPEQFKGYTEPRSDLYSLGVIMHYLLTGKDPEDTSRPSFIFEPVRKINPSAPEYIEKCVANLLEDIIDRRPDSTGAVRTLLLQTSETVTVVSTAEKSDQSPTSQPSESPPASKVSSNPSRNVETVKKALEENCQATFQNIQSLQKSVEINGSKEHSGQPTIVSAKGVGAEERMKENNESYEVLNNHLKRADYDRSCKGGDSSPSDKREDSDLKKCPYCAELIKVEAVLCKHCAESFTESELKREPSQNKQSATTPRTTRKPSIPVALVRTITVLFCLVFLSIIVKISIESNEDKKYLDIYQAIKENNLQAVKDFIRKNPSLVNAKSSSDWTPLHEAAADGHRDAAELLIAKGANVNAEDCVNITPLHVAITKGNRDVAELLLSKGANVNAKNLYGDTPLHLAAADGHRDAAELLIAKGGADVNAKGKFKELEGITPLHLAAAYGHRDAAELLIAKGANVNAEETKGDTPLHLAIANGHQDAAELLIAKGANVNAKNSTGETPLHYAATRSHREIVELLISKGANVNAKDEWGGTLLHLATKVGNQDIIDLLKRHGATGAGDGPSLGVLIRVSGRFV